ncbi:metallophosphoesterase [Desulfocurvibacter africanus]|uniref:metallophosphoesterase family protein n=1 Tax=Desulfocurvibacter africanus TaxID=873 RepID=UPI002FD935A5
MRIAAIGDLHYKEDSAGLADTILAGVEREADVLLLAGDLADKGRPEEMAVMLADLRKLSIPIVAVVGNHDHESDQHALLYAMMRDAGICVLDCETCEIDGVGFVGTKGFCGGFGARTIATFGERALKSFVGTSVAEAVRLEQAISAIRSERRVAILHYSPIRETLAGESVELYPFLGTSRLAEVLDKCGVNFVVHGHAHHGHPDGSTPGGIPVYNVSRFVLERETARCYRVLEV